MNCSYFYFLWKFIVLIYALILIPYGLVIFGSSLPFYLTFWGWCVLTLYFLFCVLSCFLNMKILLLRFLQELSFSLATVITAIIGFIWTFTTFPHYLLFYNTSYHVMNSVIMLIDLVLYPLKFKLVHIIPVLLFGLIYAVFSGIYFSITGRYEYPMIDWQSITTLWWLLAAGTGIAVAFLVGYFLSRIIPNIKEKIYTSSQKSVPSVKDPVY